MENNTLPSTIDQEILNINRALGDIADAYRTLAIALKARNEEVKTLKEDQAPTQED